MASVAPERLSLSGGDRGTGMSPCPRADRRTPQPDLPPGDQPLMCIGILVEDGREVGRRVGAEQQQRPRWFVPVGAAGQHNAPVQQVAQECAVDAQVLSAGIGLFVIGVVHSERGHLLPRWWVGFEVWVRCRTGQSKYTSQD